MYYVSLKFPIRLREQLASPEDESLKYNFPLPIELTGRWGCGSVRGRLPFINDKLGTDGEKQLSGFYPLCPEIMEGKYFIISQRCDGAGYWNPSYRNTPHTTHALRHKKDRI